MREPPSKYANHKKAFNTEKYKNSTALSKEFWRIKELNGQPKVSWKIIRRCKPFNPNSGKCNLCLNEKFEIASFKGKNLLTVLLRINALPRETRPPSNKRPLFSYIIL